MRIVVGQQIEDPPLPAVPSRANKLADLPGRGGGEAAYRIADGFGRGKDRRRNLTYAVGHVGEADARIPAERLVAAVAADGHFDVLAQLAAQQVRRYRRAVDKRLVELIEDAVDLVEVGDRFRGHDDPAVPEARVLGDDAGVRQLVELAVAETDGKCLDADAQFPGHERDQQRRIDAAAEHRAHRHIGNHVLFQRDQQGLFRLGQRLGFAPVLLVASPSPKGPFAELAGTRLRVAEE